MKLSITTLCHYAECVCAQCHILFIVMLNVIMLSVIMLSVIMLHVAMLRVVASLKSITQNLAKNFQLQLVLNCRAVVQLKKHLRQSKLECFTLKKIFLAVLK
jgi:hypothetical protein